MNDRIIFENVSKFYGEVLGVNRVSLNLPPGITTLVGPNGSGKTTLMNLMTGLVQPSNGKISVLGLTPDDAYQFFRNVGYCTQFDSFPRGLTGWQFLIDSLLLFGMSKLDALRLATDAVERVGLGDAARRKIAGYSKGMRQKIRLAQAIAHHPRVLILDEPLNGLDPVARAESLALFEELSRQGMHLVVSSHILDEVDRISDRVVLITGGYVVAEGNIQEVRREVRDNAEAQARTLGYSAAELASVPDGANLGLGCGNPLAIASLKVGQVVLDLGAGAGFDAFLAARAVGPTGRVIGVDMTPEMVAKARANAKKGGYAHVEFRLGEIEALPVADASVDVILSNCVINLCPDKRPVYREAFRVLKPGGRIAVSDVVAREELSEEVKRDLALQTGCLAGATLESELRAILAEAGFTGIAIRAKGNTDDVITSWETKRGFESKVFAAEITATKGSA